MSRRAQHAQEEESIYNLIPQPTTSASRPSLYRSKYPHDTPPTGSTFGPARATSVPTTNLQGAYELKQTTHRHVQNGASFGPNTAHSSDPARFQSANAKPTLPQPTRFEYTTRTKAALDTHHSPDSAVAQSRTQAVQRSATKNFISENALAVIMAEARRPVRPEVDYTKKPDFGKTPAYLDKVKAEIDAEKSYIRQVMEAQSAAAHAGEPTVSVLPEEERQQLLHALKVKWETTNRAYQTTTHMIVLDTQGKIRRKEQYETELQQIEKSIQKLSKPNVLIQNY